MALTQSTYSLKTYVRALFSSMHTTTVIPLSYILNRTGIPKEGLVGATKFETILAAMVAIPSAVQAVSPWLEAAVSEVLFIMGKMWYYKFLLNPQNVNFSHTKLQSVEETSDHTIINTYRNAAMGMNFKGISGCTMPRDVLKALGTDAGLPNETYSRYPKLSAAWIKFTQLEKFYKDINSDVVIFYDMDMYVGKFVNLNYMQDANNPWVINYDMSFKLYPDLMLRSLSIFDYGPFFDALRTRYGSAFATNFEGK